MTEQYGPPIPVNGMRPEWLRDGAVFLFEICDNRANWTRSTGSGWDAKDWEIVTAIRLPITHPASICQQRALDHPDEAPFYPVHADGTVRVGYDGGEVLYRHGQVVQPERGTMPGLSMDLVGYRRKATETRVYATFTHSKTGNEPMPTCDPERFAKVCSIEEAAMRIYAHWEFGDNSPGNKPEWVEGGNSNMQDVARRFARAAIPDTHALVERMTIKQWDAFAASAPERWGSVSADCAASLGIIKPDPDPIAEYAAKHSLDVDELRELLKGAVA